MPRERCVVDCPKSVSSGASLAWRLSTSIDSEKLPVGRQESQIVDDMPDVAVMQQITPGRHVECRWCPVSDHPEDLTVSRSVIPMVIHKIWRRLASWGCSGTSRAIP